MQVQKKKKKKGRGANKGRNTHVFSGKFTGSVGITSFHSFYGSFWVLA
jgi:hypothetical protein